MFDDDEEIPEFDEKKNTTIIRDKAIDYFCELWSVENLKEIIDSGIVAREYCAILLRHFADVKRIELTNQQKLANILYEILGSKFLRNQKFLAMILEAIQQKNLERWNHILQQTQNYYKDDSIQTPDSIAQLKRVPKWMSYLARLLDLDESCAVKEEKQRQPSREDITPVSRLSPLYDYQYALSREIKEMLEGSTDEKHAIIAIPTGAGKTRLMVETIVDWLNEKGFEKKFIFWLAQSEELCEQAINTFKEVFQDKGRFEKLTIHRFFKGNNALPSPYDSGIIVANISMISAHINELDEFASRTSLIVIDEVHRSTSKMYRKFYKKMGFDFRKNRAKNTPENRHKIALIGLSATPFRGNFVDPLDEDNPEETKETETEKLHRYYHDNIRLPIIPDSELEHNNKVPHAIIEVEKKIHQNGWIRISGSRSYDEDGRIISYSWEFYDKNNEQIDSRTGETISYRFDSQGTFKIALIVKDEENSESYVETYVTVLPPLKKKKLSIQDDMKLIHHNLVAKQILSDVHHRIIKLEDNNDNFNKPLKEYNIEFSDSVLQKLGENKTRNIRTIEEIQKLIDEGRKSILFFAASVNHAQDLSIVLNSMGIESRYVISDMDSFDRFDAIKKFKNQDITVLCNYGVLTQGFDAPLTDAVIVARPTMSHLLYNQMVGRGLRGVKNGGTENCILVDYEDNILKRTLREVGIKKDLVWVDFTRMWSSSEKIPETTSESSKVAPKIPPLNYADFESQLDKKLVTCPHCKLVTAAGYPEIKNKFGFTPGRISKSNPFGIQSWCRQCRVTQLEERKKTKSIVLPHIMPKSFDELVTFADSKMQMESNYQPLTLIGLLENGPMEKVEIAQILAKQNNSNNYSNYMDVPVYDILTSNDIVVLDHKNHIYRINAELQAKEKFDLIQLLQRKLNASIISKTKSLKLKAIDYYEKFIGEHGHPPTSRIFEELDTPVGLDFFQENYESYENFQKEHGIDVFGNTALREKLFDQFFEAYNEIKSKPTMDEVSHYGEFSPEDYLECFGAYKSFFSVVDPILDKLKDVQPLGIDDLKRDYFNIRIKISHPPTFDETRLKSDKGIEYYIKAFGSYGKFKDEVAIEDELIIIDKKIKTEFYELKNKLNFIPSYHIMREFSKSISEHGDLIEQLYSSYSKFLKSMNEKETEITSAIRNQKKKELERRFQKLIKSVGEKNALYSLQKDEVLYKQWFSGITQFLQETFPYLLSKFQYEVLEARSSGIQDVNFSPNNLYTVSEVKQKKDSFVIKKPSEQTISDAKQKTKNFGFSKNYKISKTKEDEDDYVPPELKTVYSVPTKPENQFGRCPNCKNLSVTISKNGKKKCTFCPWLD